MECTFAFIADAANQDAGGKLNVLGIFDQVRPLTYPHLHPQMFLIVSFHATPAEFGKQKRFEISLRDPDGHALMTTRANGVVPKPEAGKRATFQIVLQMVNTPFPRPGPYEIAVLVGDDQKATIPLEAVEPPKPAKPQRRRKT